VGGDDFVMVARTEKAERVCKAVTRCFRRLVRNHYSEEDRRLGFIRGRDRSGVEQDFPLVSVSLAIVDCVEGSDLASIAQRSAELKKYAKNIPGDSYVRDRRAPVGNPKDD
jgi:hypothetical protein